MQDCAGNDNKNVGIPKEEEENGGKGGIFVGQPKGNGLFSASDLYDDGRSDEDEGGELRRRQKVPLNDHEIEEEEDVVIARKNNNSQRSYPSIE